MADNELYHVGVKGMKWGVRRYQNKDGSLTALGRKRYGYDVGKELGKVISNAKNQIKTAADKYKAKKAAEKSAEEESKKRNKPIQSLTDDELKAKINRLSLERQALDLERQVASLNPQSVSAGKTFITDFANKAITPALMDAGKRVATDFLTKKGKDLLGLSDTNIDPFKELKKSVEGLNLQKQKNELEKYFEREANKKQKSESKNTKDDKSSESKNTKDNKSSESKSSESKAFKTNNDDHKVHEGTVVGEGTSKSKTKTESEAKPFTRSNSNARSVHDVYNEMYSSGKSTVHDLYKSGFSMTPVSKCESYTNTKDVSNARALLSDIGDWKMRNLE